MKRKHFKKVLATLLASSILITGIPTEPLYGAERYEQVDVAAEKVPISEMFVYKDADYSFLKDFDYGKNYSGTIDAKIITAADMITCEDARIKEGRIIQTSGFYKEGDGGAGTYEITAKEASGSVKLDNGLYATLLPDTMQWQGHTWAIINPRQLGAKGDGKTSEHGLLMQAFNLANTQAQKEEIFRSIVYLPAGEYKCTGQVHLNVQNINIVGDGDETVLFTDNDYTSYYEFFMWGSGAQNLYLGNFKVEARERDMSRYYRQVTFVDSSNVYMYQVNMIIPQEAFSMDYFVDKQYTNLTFYAGNRDMTVDSCRMELMCSTYRGANLGILDFYCRGEENITVMNCELYDNARDEQIGIFTGVTNREASFIKNVHFINNDVYTYTPLDKNSAGGHRTMCFTVAYDASQNIENIHIAGNHFRSQVDSKFMTFGNVDNCVVENNIIEADCTGNNGSYIFEAGAVSLGDVKLQNNEIYVTRYGKAAVCSGSLEFSGNRVLSDGPIGSILYQNGTVEDNDIISLRALNQIIQNGLVCKNNRVTAYGTFGGILLVGGSPSYENATAYIQNNVIQDYERKYLINNNAPWEAAVGTIRGSFAKNLVISGNTYLSPNRYLADGQDRSKQIPRGVLYCNGASLEKVTVSDNKFQQIDGMRQYGCDINKVTEYSNNTILDYEEYTPDEEMYNEVYITQNGEKVTEIYTTKDSVTLESNVTENADWYTSVESLATVDNGVVTRKKYSDVTVFVIPQNGSKDENGKALYGKCIVHFQKEKATDIELQSTSLTMQPGKKNDIVYQVNPVDKVSQTLYWESSNEEVATVSSDGIIEAVAAGKATITGRTGDGSNLSATIEVNVVPKTVKKIVLDCSVWDNNDAGVNVGETKQLTVWSYTPSDAQNKGISRWVSTNPQVATVDENGLVTAVGAGHAEIRAYSMDDYCYGSCTVWVNPEPITGLKEEHGQDYVKLSWDKQENIDGYRIYLYNKEKDTWELKSTQSGTSYTVYSTKVGGYIEGDKDYTFAVTSYSQRTDQNAYKHFYENMESTISLHTYKEAVINSFGNSVPSSLAVTVGGTSKFSIYIDKTKYEYYVEDTSIATVKDVSPNYDACLEVTGVKDGKTNLYITSLDEKGYTKKIPLLVHDFETFTLETVGGVKSITAKWQVKNIAKIDGFRFIRSWKFNDSGIDIPLSEVTVETSGDVANCSYTFSELENNKTYQLTVKPYIIMEDTIYAGGGSNTSECTTIEYVNVDNILADDIIILQKNEENSISAKAQTENATEPKLSFRIFNQSIAELLEEKETETKEFLAKIKGLKPGVTTMDIIAYDDNNYTKTIKIAVVPKQVTGLSAVSNGTSVTLTWNKTHENASYQIYRKQATDNQWSSISKVSGETYTDTNLKPESTYQYKVAAYVTDQENSCYEGQCSIESTVTIQKVSTVTKEEPDSTVTPTITLAPSATKTPSTTITPSATKTPCITVTPSATVKLTATPGPSITIIPDTTITPTIMVTPSPTVTGNITVHPTATTKPTPTVKNTTPKDFKLQKATKSSITLTWKKVADVAGYEVSIYKNKKWTTVAKVSQKSNSVTVKKLGSGKKYKFRIRCYTLDDNKVTYRGPVYCYGVTKPSKVNFKKLTSTSKTMKLQWKKISCNGYEITYSTSKKFKNAKKITVNTQKATTKTIKGLKTNRVYYVKIRAFTKLNGKKYYGTYSKTKKSTLE